jgi:hypothetical protein
LSASAREAAGRFFLHIPSTLRAADVHRLAERHPRSAGSGLSTPNAALIIITNSKQSETT